MWRFRVGGELAFEDPPEMLNGVEVRRLWRPLHDIDFVLFEAACGLFAGMLGIIVLLEYNVIRVILPMKKGMVKLVLNDLHVEVGIHLPSDLARMACPLPPKLPPEHQAPTTKLECSLHHPVTEVLALLLPHALPPI